MTTHQAQEPRWRERIEEIPSEVEAVRFPKIDSSVSQDHEYCLVRMNGQDQRVRFHDYDEVYRIPGLYEHLFYRHLKCTSPSRVAGLLGETIADTEGADEPLRVLDVGAGNGMVGDELDRLNCERIVGIDIVPEAQRATMRDRPGVYRDYLITDLTDLPEEDERRLRNHKLNALTCVAALGFGDIPPRAFAKALDLVSTPGWMAFNIKEDFVAERDTSGFCKLMRELRHDGVVRMEAYRRYRHRMSMDGKPLYYIAMVARKLKDLPDHTEALLEAIEGETQGEA